jgi:hypothetical protein
MKFLAKILATLALYILGARAFRAFKAGAGQVIGHGFVAIGDQHHSGGNLGGLPTLVPDCRDAEGIESSCGIVQGLRLDIESQHQAALANPLREKPGVVTIPGGQVDGQVPRP